MSAEINITDLVGQVPVEQLQALLAAASKRQADEAVAIAAKRLTDIKAFVAEYNEILLISSNEISDKAKELNVQFAIVWNTEEARYMLIDRPMVSPKTVRAGASGRGESVNYSAAFHVSKDGIDYTNQYSNYAKAFAGLVGKYEGSHPSFNARTELIRCGYQVGGPTR